MRKLVTLRKISDIRPIEGADAIELAMVDGWQCVVKKGQFGVGQVVYYIEIDSVLPKGRTEFEFLMTRSCKMQTVEDGTLLEGHRLRTIKLRGQISQGLVIPLRDADVLTSDSVTHENKVLLHTYSEEYGEWVFKRVDFDDDLSEYFGVKKYEKPIPSELSGIQRGNYPAWLPKTDQDRIQNCWHKIPAGDFIVEEKFEGSSMTIYGNGLDFGVTSRTVDLLLDQTGNKFVDTAHNSGIFQGINDFMFVHGDENQLAIRGELIGPNIQGNIYNLRNYRFMVFDVFLNGKYLTHEQREEFIAEFVEPFTEWEVVGFSKPIATIRAWEYSLEELIKMADGKSVLNANTDREGLVLKSVKEFGDNSEVFSFKIISNAYLLSEKKDD